MTYKFAKVKVAIETIIIYPIVLLGKLYGTLYPLKNKHSIFLFYSNADTGGAAVCNADILEVVKNYNPLIIFSKKSKNNSLIKLFEKDYVTLIDLSKKIDNKYFHFVNIFYRGVISAWINQQKPKVIFGGEAIYFYKVIPFVQKQTLKIELSHLNTWLAYNIGFIGKLNKRVFSTSFLMNEVKEQYAKNGLLTKYNNRLCFIDNAYILPTLKAHTNKILQVLYIGRGVAQKRIHLIAAAAKILHEKKAPVHFNFVGDVHNIINTTNYPYCTFFGTISNNGKLQKIYNHADLLLLTSAYEGLPMVVISMMANSKPILSTAVNAIPDYITHNENGFLIFEKDEIAIINKVVEYIEFSCLNRDMLRQMGEKNRKKAEKLFNHHLFRENYLKLFELI